MDLPVDGIVGCPDPGHVERRCAREPGDPLPSVRRHWCSLPSSLQAARSGVRHAPPAETSRTVGVGTASWYGNEFRGSRTASGEPLESVRAHGSVEEGNDSIGTRVRVTNLENQRSTVVRINDRGPFVRGRVLDVSHAAARELGMVGRGTARVRIGVLDRGGSSRAAGSAVRRRRRARVTRTDRHR